jgi:hypothetical protein
MRSGTKIGIIAEDYDSISFIYISKIVLKCLLLLNDEFKIIAISFGLDKEVISITSLRLDGERNSFS